LIQRGVSGKYFNGKLDEVNWRDASKNGERRKMFIARETILTDTDPIVVTRILGDGEDPAKWKKSAERDQRVVIKITRMNVEKGNITLSGIIEPLV